MAFVDDDSEDSAGNARFYNLTKSVGYGCPNEKEDTMIVQFFLQRIYNVEKLRPHKPKGDMKVDGKVGPITRNWILKFQLDMRKGGHACYADGVMDKAGNEENPNNYLSSITRTRYAIRLLNNGMRRLDSTVYNSLPTHPEVPPELREIFTKLNAANALNN